jgi:prevent-host-death family protein
MRNIPATEFKAKCLELMDRVAERHETFVITKRGTPVAKLMPVDRKPRGTLFGCLRNEVTISGDIVRGAIPVERWATVEEWDELTTPRKAKGRSTGTRVRKSGRIGR